MANRSRFSIAKPKIEAYFENNKSKIYTPRAIETIFSSEGAEWRFAVSATVREFITFLLERSRLRQVTLEFPNEKITRYIWGDDTSAYELALSLKPEAYLSHYTAVFLHDLTEQIPKTIFVTSEQPRKSQGDALTQTVIDEAFSRPVRETTKTAFYKDYNITLLNGQFTQKAGVLKQEVSSGQFPVTNLERTLIDIAVRPVYSGGVFEVMKAYEKAKDKVQINKLKAYLKQINFIYPYHQVIGFYLERAGIPEKRLALWEDSFDKNVDFYLVHNMQNKEYSKRWRLYYPSDI